MSSNIFVTHKMQSKLRNTQEYTSQFIKCLFFLFAFHAKKKQLNVLSRPGRNEAKLLNPKNSYQTAQALSPKKAFFLNMKFNRKKSRKFKFQVVFQIPPTQNF